MPMLCKVAAGFSDVLCPVCGQGFLVYDTGRRSREQDEQRRHLHLQLRAHHAASDRPAVHPPAFPLQNQHAPAPRPAAQPVLAPPVPAFN